MSRVMSLEEAVRMHVPDEMLFTLADPPAYRGAGWATQTTYLLGQMAAGGVQLGLIGGAQIDRHGNLNTSRIGTGDELLARLPGGGGATDFACLAHRTIIALPHEKRRFVERVDFITSPGYGEGGDWRTRQGLPRGGPCAVISTLGLLRFDDAGEAYLASYHPHSSVREVVDNTGWDLVVAPDVAATPPPTGEELAVIREYDPAGFWAGG